MTGWIKFSNDDTSHYYRSKKDTSPEPWPPRFWKFILHLENDSNEIAFVDPRRLARIRLVEAAASELRNTTPLKENGPDPVIDKDILTADWLTAKLSSKRVPVKALLLDQANISGIGNWVADEILYQSRIHPEQYSNTLNSAQVTALHKAMMHVCDIACGTLADSSQFPEDWLMRYRWDKGKKDANVLPNGDKITHVKVGGRTSAIVARVQKKTGKTAVDDRSDVEESDEASSVEEKPATKKPTKKAKKEEPALAADGKPKTTRAAPKRKATKAISPSTADADIKDEVEDESEQTKPAKKPRQTVDKTDKKTAKTKGKAQRKTDKAEVETGRRRSGRLSGQNA